MDISTLTVASASAALAKGERGSASAALTPTSLMVAELLTLLPTMTPFGSRRWQWKHYQRRNEGNEYYWMDF